MQIPRPYPKGSDPGDLEWALRVRSTDSSPVMLMLLIQEPHRAPAVDNEEPLMYYCLYFSSQLFSLLFTIRTTRLVE